MSVRAQTGQFIPEEGKAVCPRCGTPYPIEKPVEFCIECGLKLGRIDEYGDLEWTETMKEPFPDFVSQYSPEEIFMKTISWYYQKWIKEKKGNPSYNLP